MEVTRIYDMLDIQMVQSRLTIYADAMQYARIASDLFDQGDDVSVALKQSDLGIPDVSLQGIDAVRTYYAGQDELVHVNGDFLGANLSCSQQIKVDPDGKNAGGIWYTVREDVIGPAYGHTEMPYPYQVSVGRYDNTFVKTEDGWRLKNISWSPVLKLNTYETSVQPDGQIRPNTRDWPEPWELYKNRPDARAAEAVQAAQEDSEEDIRYCEAVLAIRNQGGALCEAWNSGKLSDMAARFFTPDAVFFRQGMPQPVCGAASVQKVFNRYDGLARRSIGIPGMVMMTSGVVEADPTGTLGRSSWTLLCLDVVPDGAGEGADPGRKVTLKNHTGRWYMDWVKTEDGFKIRKMDWVYFTHMPDLEGRRVDV